MWVGSVHIGEEARAGFGCGADPAQQGGVAREARLLHFDYGQNERNVELVLNTCPSGGRTMSEMGR